MQQIVLPQSGMKKKDRKEAYRIFVHQIKVLGEQIGFKVSARGWCYQMESFGLINKDEFDRVESIINKCRRNGLLPIDFTAEEDARKFSGVEEPEDEEPISYMRKFLKYTLRCGEWYTPNWWDGEKYYVQMLVEKVDLKTLFKPVCEEYHIPVATAKGWSSMLQRAEYARRFKEAEDMGLTCVLLYMGDHDPDGLRISDFIRKNLRDIMNIEWDDGFDGYDPKHLIIDRFGLNYNFIAEHNLTWIDNLITGTGRNLASPLHKNHHMDYVQDYLKKYGARKCEANAIIPQPEIARTFCRDVIEGGNNERESNFRNVWHGVGPEALGRFKAKRQAILDELVEYRKKLNIDEPIKQAIKAIDDKIGEEVDDE